MTDSSTETLDLRGYLRPLRSRWWIVVLIAVAAEGFTYQYFAGKPPRYAASTTLLLQPDAATVASGGDPGDAVREQAVIIGTRAIARLVAEELGTARDPNGLPGVVTAEPSKGTNFLQLTSSSSNPRSAVELVNAYARVYISYSGDAGRMQARRAGIAAKRRLEQVPDTPANRSRRLQLEARIQSLGVQENANPFQAQQIEPALTAKSISSSPGRSAVFALVLGALLGIGLAYALEHLDRRLKRLEEIAELYDSPVLVAVPGAPRAAKASRLELKLEPPLTEVFRTLRTTLQLRATSSAGGVGARPRTLLVTSAISGEGKSTVARSLALAYYEAGLRVALVDADLRRPTLADNFDLDPEPGLADVLRGRPLADALRCVWRTPHDGAGRTATTEMAGEIQREAVGASAEPRPRSGLPLPGQRRPPSEGGDVAAVSGLDGGSGNGLANEPGLSVLTSGRTPRDPAALLAGGPVEGVLRDLETTHDIVIVDTSPLLPVSDAAPLLAAVDGVLIVSRLGVTTRHAVEQLTGLLARVPNVNVLGVVANDVREQAGYGYGGYGYGEA